jgi:hypothetical protein
VNDTIERPEVVTEEHLEYLDDLRESGVTNMFGAAQYVEEDCDVSRRDSRTILSYWMESFEERHPRGEES